MTVRERIDAFPTQLIMTVVWATVGTTISFILRSSILWVSLISIYAIVISHFTAHIAWKGKRIAEEIVEEEREEEAP
jgi:hypothetical protein